MNQLLLIMLVAMPTVSLLTACTTASEHRQAVADNATDKMTVGTVQREIKVGMSGAQVLEVLGSPNVVSSDEMRREVWVYDKISTDSVYSESSSGVASLILSVGSSLTGGLLPQANQRAGAQSTSQKTLTVIIKFDEDKKVRDFAYHASSF